MENKSRKPLFFKTFLIILLIFIFILLIFVGIRLNMVSILGLSIFELEEMGSFTPMFFIGIWLVFIFLLVFVYIRDKIIYNREIKIISKEMVYSGYDTDLDVLYSILKNRKNLKIKVIARVFQIDSEKAMKWAKILESKNLVSIEYPGFFGNPEIVITNKA